MNLDAVPWQATRYPGVAVHFYRRDRASGRVLALIRMAPGCGYPRHGHHGPEDVLVLRGGYRDEAGEYPAGTFVRYEADSEHGPVAFDGDEPCVLLAVAHEGVRLLA